jgi:hypothetical protein
MPQKKKGKKAKASARRKPVPKKKSGQSQKEGHKAQANKETCEKDSGSTTTTC